MQHIQHCNQNSPFAVAEARTLMIIGGGCFLRVNQPVNQPRWRLVVENSQPWPTATIGDKKRLWCPCCHPQNSRESGSYYTVFLMALMEQQFRHLMFAMCRTQGMPSLMWQTGICRGQLQFLGLVGFVTPFHARTQKADSESNIVKEFP